MAAFGQARPEADVASMMTNVLGWPLCGRMSRPPSASTRVVARSSPMPTPSRLGAGSVGWEHHVGGERSIKCGDVAMPGESTEADQQEHKPACGHPLG